VRQDIHAVRDAYAAAHDLTVHNYYAGGAEQGERTSRGPVVGQMPQQPPGFQPREELLAVLDASGPGVSVVHASRALARGLRPLCN
jgi:hypothetical protein